MKPVLNIKDFMIEHYVNGEPVTETEWLLYMEYMMEEAERRQDDHRGE